MTTMHSSLRLTAAMGVILPSRNRAEATCKPEKEHNTTQEMVMETI
jgi:hypothetical protein